MRITHSQKPTRAFKDFIPLKVITLADQLPCAYMRVSSKGILLEYNGLAEEYFHLFSGFNVDLQKTNISKLLIKNTDFILKLEQFAKSKMSGSFKKKFQSSEDLVQLQFNIKPVVSTNGRVESLTLIFCEITEQEQLKRDLKNIKLKKELVSKATHDIIWDWDLINDTMYRSHNGKEAENLKGKSWYEVIHPQDYKRVKASVEKALYELKEDFWEGEYRYSINEGSYSYVQDKGYIVYDQNRKPIRMVGVMRDITEQKEQQDLLHLKNNNLQKFAYVLSHKTRSPLANILSCVELLEHKNGSMDPETKTIIDAMKTSALGLDETLRELNDICKIKNTIVEQEFYDSLSNSVSSLNIEDIFLDKKPK